MVIYLRTAYVLTAEKSKIINNMGVWTQVEGKHNSKKVSAKKLVSDTLDGQDFVFSNLDGNSFEFRLESDGMHAAKHIQKIVENFKTFDKTAWIELSATILFY